MTKYILCIGFFIASTILSAQNGYPKYYEMVALDAKADSLYKAKDFKNAARFYLATSNIIVEKAITMDYSSLHYDAACSWALASMPDSAFAELDLITSKMNYNNYKHLIKDTDLNSLHADNRWKLVCDRAMANEEGKERYQKLYKDRTTFQGASKEIIFYPHTEQMRKFIDNDSLPFLSVDHGNFRIYFRGNSNVVNYLPQLRQGLDSAFRKILEVVGITGYYHGLNLVMVDSAGELKQLTGMYVHGGFSLQGNDEIFFVYNTDRKFGFRHEIFHFISNDIWGFNRKSRLLNEGGAVYTEGVCYEDYSMYGISAYLMKEKKLFTFKSLIDNFHDMEMQSEEIAYFESGAIFKYLYEKYGIEKMKQLWIKGFDSFETIYGMPLSQFEKEWRDFISTVQPPKNMNWEMITKIGCG